MGLAGMLFLFICLLLQATPPRLRLMEFPQGMALLMKPSKRKKMF